MVMCAICHDLQVLEPEGVPNDRWFSVDDTFKSAKCGCCSCRLLVEAIKLCIPQVLEGSDGRIRLSGLNSSYERLVTTVKDGRQMLEFEFFTLPSRSQLESHLSSFALKKWDMNIPS